MDSYLIRIYRRCKDDPEKMVGVVEAIDTGQTHAFRSLSDLGRTLTAEKAQQGGQGNKKKRAGKKENQKA
jgi:hypothetical protein